VGHPTDTRTAGYGPLPQDRSQLLSWNFSYNLPGKQLPWKAARAVLGNWTLSGIGIATTGAPANPSCSSTAAFPYNDPSLTGVPAITQTPSTTSILGYRCQEVADPQKYTQNFYNNFNTGAFALPAIGTFGNTGRNFFIGPHYFELDASLLKRIPINERMKLEVRADATNLTNSPSFNAPTTDITSSLFGRIRNSLTSSSRKIQIGAKIHF